MSVRTRQPVAEPCPDCGVPAGSVDGWMDYPHQPTCTYHARSVAERQVRPAALPPGLAALDVDWPQPADGYICSACAGNEILHVIYPDDVAGPCPVCGQPVYADAWHYVGCASVVPDLRGLRPPAPRRLEGAMIYLLPSDRDTARVVPADLNVKARRRLERAAAAAARRKARGTARTTGKARR